MVLAFETQSLRAAISVTSGGAYSHSCITREEDQVWKDFPRLPNARREESHIDAGRLVACEIPASGGWK